MGSINEKGQLVREHPGSKQPWDWYYCNEQLTTNKVFENHSKKVHGIAQFIYFCKCGFSSETSKSTGTHMRYCEGTPPLEHQLKFKCQHCKFSSQTKNGYRFSLVFSHKSLHNEKLKEMEKNFKWMEPEFEYLAKTIIELKKNKVRNVNKVAGEKLGRTEQAIQKISTRADYKRAERKVKQEIAQKKEKQKIAQKQIRQEIEGEGEVDVVEKEVERVTIVDQQELEQVQHIREIQSTPAPVSHNQPCASDSQNRTLIRTVRRQSPGVPPTPVHENDILSNMLLQQENLLIQSTPTER